MKNERRSPRGGVDCLPSLLDRLGVSAKDAAAISGRVAYQRSVLRDLTWLLNSVSMDCLGELDGLDHVATSAINFGVPAASGIAFSEVDLKSLSDGIRRAILRFEPRIMPDSLQVSLREESGAISHSQVCFRIRAALWFEPKPLEVAFNARWDIETGAMQVGEA